MPITFDAGAIRFGAISPGKSAIQTVTSSEAPADAKVIAIITGDDASSFNINTLSSYEWILEDVGSGDLPHGFHGHPKEQVLELAGQTDGKTSLSVSEGQIVKVEVVATSPTVGNKANLSALLLI